MLKKLFFILSFYCCVQANDHSWFIEQFLINPDHFLQKTYNLIVKKMSLQEVNHELRIKLNRTYQQISTNHTDLIFYVKNLLNYSDFALTLAKDFALWEKKFEDTLHSGNKKKIREYLNDKTNHLKWNPIFLTRAFEKETKKYLPNYNHKWIDFTTKGLVDNVNERFFDANDLIQLSRHCVCLATIVLLHMLGTQLSFYCKESLINKESLLELAAMKTLYLKRLLAEEIPFNGACCIFDQFLPPMFTANSGAEGFVPSFSQPINFDEKYQEHCAKEPRDKYKKNSFGAFKAYRELALDSESIDGKAVALTSFLAYQPYAQEERQSLLDATYHQQYLLLNKIKEVKEVMLSKKKDIEAFLSTLESSLDQIPNRINTEDIDPTILEPDKKSFKSIGETYTSAKSIQDVAQKFSSAIFYPRSTNRLSIQDKATEVIVQNRGLDSIIAFSLPERLTNIPVVLEEGISAINDQFSRTKFRVKRSDFVLYPKKLISASQILAKIGKYGRFKQWSYAEELRSLGICEDGIDLIFSQKNEHFYFVASYVLLIKAILFSVRFVLNEIQIIENPQKLSEEKLRQLTEISTLAEQIENELETLSVCNLSFLHLETTKNYFVMPALFVDKNQSFWLADKNFNSIDFQTKEAAILLRLVDFLIKLKNSSSLNDKDTLETAFFDSLETAKASNLSLKKKLEKINKLIREL